MYQCRICLDEGEREEFIAPCQCRGSSQWVHRYCLDRWRSTREDRAFSKCTECLAKYKFIDPNENLKSTEFFSSNALFVCLVTRDVSLMVIVIALIVLSLSTLVYELDKTSSILINFFAMQQFYLVFYLLSGFFLFFAIMGLIGSCVFFFGCDFTEPSCRDSICMTNNYNCICCDSMYYTPSSSASLTSTSSASNSGCCMECCGSSSSQGTCTACNIHECSGCRLCDAGSIAGAGAEEGALYCCLFALVIFAFIGIFVVFLLGVAAINFVISKHIHILRKWTLTKDFIVADLAAGNKTYGDDNNNAFVINNKDSSGFSNVISNNDDIEMQNTNTTKTSYNNFLIPTAKSHYNSTEISPSSSSSALYSVATPSVPLLSERIASNVNVNSNYYKTLNNLGVFDTSVNYNFSQIQK